MAAYVIIAIDVTDPEAAGAYADAVPGTLEPYGGRFIVRGGPLTVLEGDPPASRMVVFEFPSVDQATSWYESPEYQAIVPIRLDCARTPFMVAAEGVDPVE